MPSVASRSQQCIEAADPSSPLVKCQGDLPRGLWMARYWTGVREGPRKPSVSLCSCPSFTKPELHRDTDLRNPSSQFLVVPAVAPLIKVLLAKPSTCQVVMVVSPTIGYFEIIQDPNVQHHLYKRFHICICI